MFSFFATPYTIHFDDTMAYGSHHFMTSFKFQCAARETFMFGEHVFDVPGVRDALEQIHLLTSDAYSRNHKSTVLGDRVAILLTLEQWGQVSARFCYRVVDQLGDPVCAGFQTLVCADAASNAPVPLPSALRDALDAVRQIEEPDAGVSFRDSVLAGGSKFEELFTGPIRERAVEFLSTRYPTPTIITLREGVAGETRTQVPKNATDVTQFLNTSNEASESSKVEAWGFAGQGALDIPLLLQRIEHYSSMGVVESQRLSRCVEISRELLGGDAEAFLAGDSGRCRDAIDQVPELLQVAIHLQNMLGGIIQESLGGNPPFLFGHSFGEIAAMGLAGCFDLETGVRIVCFRALAVRDHAPPGGGLMVATTNRHQLEVEIALGPFNEIRVAGRNHEKQTVLSGPTDQLAQLKDVLAQIGISSLVIASPTSFHHPRLQPAAQWWLAQMRALPIRPPRRAVFTCIGRRFLESQDDVPQLLAGQLLRPFDLQGGVADLISQGTTHLLDCGSAGSMARLLAHPNFDGVQIESLGKNALRGRDENGRRRNDSHSVSDRPHENPAADAIAEAGPSSNSRDAENHESVESTDTNPTATTLAKETDSRFAANSASETIPDVAIVGQGCILPGGATSPSELFEAIIQQRIGIVDQRETDAFWSEDFFSEDLVPDRSTSHLAGRVRDIDLKCPDGVAQDVFERFTRFQKLLCIGIAPLQGTLADAQRIMCLVGATADGFEDQDDVSALVYSGVDPLDTRVDGVLDCAKSVERTPHDAVQEVFDAVLKPGLQITLVDAACASSLYSVALGMNALEADKTDAVIAGGAFCPGPGNSCLFSQFHGTTATGCRPFDQDSDGVVFSEAAAFVTLRRVDDAHESGLPIQATILGTGLSSDGRSPSANVPQTRGQILSLHRCYENYGVDPATIQAIEAHGTSTSVGDSTELETLRQYFADHISTPLPVHSLKSTLGHAGWAAGTASMIAACEYMRRHVFPGQAGFKQPSETLQKCSDALQVSSEQQPLPDGSVRIAIDGFGFGGANAHLVLETPRQEGVEEDVRFGVRPDQRPRFRRVLDDGDELVFVAAHRLRTNADENGFQRFDRETTILPDGVLVLPELADDMDISQTLSVNLGHHLLDQLGGVGDDVRQQTSMVLALRGKTERGCEATSRIMTTRFRRLFRDQPDLLTKLNEGHDRARPSGSYTLQCMMPNVATGRAALLLNLNGPNFVIDAGGQSLKESIRAAGLLLHSGDYSGTKLAIVAAIDANSRRFSPGSITWGGQHEYAAAFAMTTKRSAQQYGWNILATVNPLLERCPQYNHNHDLCVDVRDDTWGERTPGADNGFDAVESLAEILCPQSVSSEFQNELDEQQVAVVSRPTAEKQSSPQHDVRPQSNEPGPRYPCELHRPIWVEREIERPLIPSGVPMLGSVVVVLSQDEMDDGGKFLNELRAALPSLASQFLITVVGDRQDEAAQVGLDPRVIGADLDDAASVAAALSRIEQVGPEAIITISRVRIWQNAACLDQAADDNALCEWLFLVAQSCQELLGDGQLELWNLFLDGFCKVVHSRSGPAAGLIKSIMRELPDVRGSTICTSGLALSEGLRCLSMERQTRRPEPEVVYRGETRLVRRLQRTPDESGAVGTPQVELNSQSVVVASGGARGVTAVMLHALVQDHQCTVVALGRSPLEQGPVDPTDPEVEKEYYQQFVEQHPDASAAEMRRSFESACARWEAARTIDELNRSGGRASYVEVGRDQPDRG